MTLAYKLDMIKWDIFIRYFSTSPHPVVWFCPSVVGWELLREFSWMLHHQGRKEWRVQVLEKDITFGKLHNSRNKPKMSFPHKPNSFWCIHETEFSGGSRIFLSWGLQLPECMLIYYLLFLPKTAWKWKNFDRWDGAFPGDLPWSANGNECLFF